MSHIFPEGIVFVPYNALKYFKLLRLPIETCVFLRNKIYKHGAHSPARMVTVCRVPKRQPRGTGIPHPASRAARFTCKVPVRLP